MAEEDGAAGRPPPPPSSCGGVSRQERLENMRQREELKDQLVNKFRDRYRAQRNPEEASVATTAISREVNRFVGGPAAMTEANLSRLEQRLQRRAEGRGTEFDAASQCSVSAYTVGTAAPSMQFAPSAGSRPGSLTARRTRNGTPYHPSTNGSLSARGRSVAAAADVAMGQGGAAGANAGNGSAGLEWSVLDKLAAQMHREDATRQQKTQRELQAKLKADLEKQMADSLLKLEREKEQDRRYHAMQVAADRDYREKDRAAEAARQEQRMALSKERFNQVETIRAQREEERLREREEAEAMQQAVSRGLQSDRQQAERRQDVRKGQVKEALQVGTKSSEMRAEAQRQQAEKEEQSVQDYHRTRAMRDRAKKDTKEKELAQRDVLASRAAEQALLRKREEEALASRADVERAVKNKKDAEQEQAREERLSRMRRQTQAYQVEQIKEKEGKRVAMSEQKRQQREDTEMEAKTMEDLDRRRELARRCWNSEHRAELERQMAAKTATAPGKDVMSDCELRLNRPLLERACQALNADQLVVAS